MMGKKGIDIVSQEWYNKSSKANAPKCRKHPARSDHKEGNFQMATNDSTPDTITIPLTKGQVTIVDAVDGDLAQFKWSAQFNSRYANGGKFRAYRRITINEKRPTIHLHRVILSRMLGRPLLRSEEVDHRNTDPLNNRRDNLRLATRSQNCANRGLHSNSTSGHKGVSWHKDNHKWYARIYKDGKVNHLGYFDTAEEAFAAYCKAAPEIHGEFANFGDAPRLENIA